MKLKRTVAVAVLVLVAASQLPGDEIVGWRTDWTGKYPDADPPTSWSAAENVIWKTPMPAWGNATPVLVGDRIFVCAEPTTLVCVDAKTGAILWQAGTTYFDALPPEESARLRKLADAIDVDKTHRSLRSVRGKISRLDNQLKQKTRALDNARKQAEQKKDDVELQKKLADEIARIEQELPELRKQVEAERPALAAEAVEIEAKLKPVEALLLPDTHGANGYSSPTPVSDGTNVYAFFTTGVVTCFDLEGRRKWATMTEKPTLTYGVSASPLLADGKVIVHPRAVHALDAATGREVWRQESAPLWGSPALAEIEGRKVVLTNSGDWLLAADGRKLPTGPTCKLTYNQPIVAGGIAYFIQNGGKAFRLPTSTDGTPQLLWQTKPKKDRYYASPVIHEGLIYAVTQMSVLSAIDAKTGEVVYEQNLKLGRQQAFPSIALAGKLLFISNSDGNTAIIEPGREFREVARNKLEPFRATPVFRGTRMFVRTLKHLYCIGR